MHQCRPKQLYRRCSFHSYEDFPLYTRANETSRKKVCLIVQRYLSTKQSTWTITVKWSLRGQTGDGPVLRPEIVAALTPTGRKFVPTRNTQPALDRVLRCR